VSNEDEQRSRLVCHRLHVEGVDWYEMFGVVPDGERLVLDSEAPDGRTNTMIMSRAFVARLLPILERFARTGSIERATPRPGGASSEGG
jgi:hypothetical protein